MLPISRARVMGLALVTAVAGAVPTAAQTRITTPKEQLGYDIGDDYFLATYSQLVDYWKKLDAESDRLVVQEIGKTGEGRPQLMAIITSPENHAKLARYREIARRLALAEGLTDDQAKALAQEGKAVVWIDGGLHGTEVLGAHQLMELVYQMVSRTDPETMRFLNDDVLLAVQANPDGMELVSGWYMRETDPLKRSTEGLPRLYQKYIGHDNNRDFYIVNQPETENMARVLYIEWSPQILYNHHQTGPQGVILFAPPFRDPYNYNLDPLLMAEIDGVGAAMHERFIAEGKPGATARKGASYQTWWNGGLRTTAYFHNMIGLLTESKGSPTPMQIPFYPERQLPSGDLLWPIPPQQTWHFRQSIEYSMTADRAVLDYASRNREKLLYHVYLMGKRSIERGSRDHWTIHPKLIDAVKAAVAADPAVRLQGERFPGFGREVPARFFQLLRDPANRDPRGYIIPADQPDFPTAVKFVNTLVKNGVTIHQATSSFTVGGKQYPAGSYVVKAAQAFRPHVIDMFEPQDYPNDFTYQGGPPIPPYDNAGYTLAYQMGVQFDRILDGFDGPFVKTNGMQKPPAGMVAGAQGAQGFLLSHAYNDGFVATNRVMAKKYEVQWLTEPFEANGKTYPAGTIYLPAKSGLVPLLQQLATDLGLRFEGVAKGPEVGALRLRPVRVALWERYGGSMPAGWVRWLLERFEFPFDRVWPQTLDQGQLAKKYDVIIFPTEAIPETDRRGGGGEGAQPDAASIPAEFRGWLGNVTVEKTVPQLKQFLADGGTIIAIGSSIAMGNHAGLAIANQLVDQSGKPLPEEKFYVPGSVLQVRVDNTRPIAYGTPERMDVFFDQSPVMKLLPDAKAQGVTQVAWFDSDTPLRSGWAWGQQYLKGGVTMAEARVGRGQLYLLAPEVTNRGQPHGTFKFLFNGIYLAGATQIRGAAAQ